MFTAVKIESTIKPEKFQSLNNGIWYYNYNIEERQEVFSSETEIKEDSIYSFIQVRIKGKPTLSKCYEAILKSYISEDKTNLYDASKLDNTLKELLDEIYFNVKVDFGLEKEISLVDKAKKELLKKIDIYDKSTDVNSFFINENLVWLDKDTRVGLMNSLTIEKKSGKEISTLWFGDISISISCDSAILMLNSLELYAIKCYNITSLHKVVVTKLNNIEDIINYDFTLGYPSKLIFNI